MANTAIYQKLTTNSTVKKHELGETVEVDGNVYIYLQGVASTAANDFVTYNGSFATALLTTTSIGPVAIAMAATVASEYGWYLVSGTGTGRNGGSILGATGAAAIYAHAVTGAALTTMVTGDLIHGAYSVGTSTVTGAGVTMLLQFPHIDQASGSY